LPGNLLCRFKRLSEDGFSPLAAELADLFPKRLKIEIPGYPTRRTPRPLYLRSNLLSSSRIALNRIVINRSGVLLT
jgi:hypothetical protein